LKDRKNHKIFNIRRYYRRRKVKLEVRKNMKENISTGIAVLAIVISIVAVASTVIVKPVSTIGAGAIGENELADNSVTSGKVADGALTDADISDSGISKIADDAIAADQIASSSITLLHLSSEVIEAIAGETNVTADIADNSVTSAKIANWTITNVDIANDSITGAKIADWTITTEDLANNSVTSEKIVDGEVKNSDIADNAVTSAKITDSTITADDIEDYTQIISFPAHALNYHDLGTTITEYSHGLLWKASYGQAAYLTLPGPLDWDGETNVTMHLYFRSGTSDSGDVQFFISPRAYDSGDLYGDAASVTGDAVTVSAANTVYEQVIEIPASKFGSKELWVITIQREGSLSTYTDDVVLLSVSLSYNAVR
jgi:hypothetical protein